MANKDNSLKIPVLKVAQPIGDFYVGVMSGHDLIDISKADMRRIESDVDRYIGIQRKLSPSRVKEISGFVNTIDAAFPTSIVLAIDGSCAEYDEKNGILSLHEGVVDYTGEHIGWDEIASILDGQHRLEGLKAFNGNRFDLTVSIFVNADMADQAYIFATVNLAQTKVNRSLVYDLLDYSKARSPQKSCHDVAVALDKHEKSPFKGMIKRLGTATPGRSGETLAQATFVGSLLPFVSARPLDDRDALARRKSVKSSEDQYPKTPFRELWVQERDTDIARILIAYFSAVAEKWDDAWVSRDKGDILPRTNGFRGFMRLLKPLILHMRHTSKDLESIPTKGEFRKFLDKSKLSSTSFNTEQFPPGTSGETRLFDSLRCDILGG